jgi:hypothetical protein
MNGKGQNKKEDSISKFLREHNTKETIITIPRSCENKVISLDKLYKNIHGNLSKDSLNEYEIKYFIKYAKKHEHIKESDVLEYLKTDTIKESNKESNQKSLKEITYSILDNLYERAYSTPDTNENYKNFIKYAEAKMIPKYEAEEYLETITSKPKSIDYEQILQDMIEEYKLNHPKAKNYHILAFVEDFKDLIIKINPNYKFTE